MAGSTAKPPPPVFGFDILANRIAACMQSANPYSGCYTALTKRFFVYLSICLLILHLSARHDLPPVYNARSQQNGMCFHPAEEVPRYLHVFLAPAAPFDHVFLNYFCRRVSQRVFDAT